MTFIGNILINLSRQLLPSGRAFRMPDNGVFRKFQEGVNASNETTYNDMLSVLDSILPDNDNFSEDDATAWERRLGLIISPDTDLEDRKLAIARKIQHPGTQKPRQNYLYVQSELQKAGFDVFVFENRFPDGSGGYFTKTPVEVAISPIASPLQHGQVQHGQAQLGSSLVDKIVNSLDPARDKIFDVGDNLRSTFFISSSTLGLNAVIPASRLVEFRKLVLTLKPVQTVAFPFVSFIEPIKTNILTEDNFLFLLEDGGEILKEDAYA